MAKFISLVFIYVFFLTITRCRKNIREKIDQRDWESYHGKNEKQRLYFQFKYKKRPFNVLLRNDLESAMHLEEM